METVLIYFVIYIVIAFAFGSFIDSMLEYEMKTFVDYLLRILIGMFWPVALFMLLMSSEGLGYLLRKKLRENNNEDEPSSK